MQDQQRIAFWGLQPRQASCKFPHIAREGEHLYRDKKEFGRAIAYRVHNFSLARPLGGGVRSLLPIEFSCSKRLWELLPSGISTLCNWGFRLLIFYSPQVKSSLWTVFILFHELINFYIFKDYQNNQRIVIFYGTRYPKYLLSGLLQKNLAESMFSIQELRF